LTAPPSISKVWPTIKLESVLHRTAQALPNSSGVPNRPAGTSFVRDFAKRLVVLTRFSGELGHAFDLAIGGERPGQQVVDDHVMPRDLRFLRGRRYVSVHGAPEYFTLYEAESPQVLSGQDYANRLNNPTPWRLEAVRHFRNSHEAADVRRAQCSKIDGSRESGGMSDKKH
jgi:hypothetical protein